MLDNGCISSVQLLLLLQLMEVVTAAIFLPANVARLAGPDAWLASSVGPLLYGLLVAGVVLALAGRFPAQTFTEYLPDIAGKVCGKLLAAAYALMFIHVSSLILTESTSLVHIVFLPLTPDVVIDTVWVIIAVYGSYLGIEAIARENQLILPVWFIVQGVILAMLIKDINFSNLRPVLENGLLPVIRGGIGSGAWRGELFLMLMLYPYLNQKREALSTVLWHLIVVTLSWILFMAGMIGVFGAPFLAHLVFPYFVFVQYLSAAHFIERVETVFVVIWMAGVLIKLAVLFHSAAIAGANTLGLKSYRVMLIPIAIITVVLSRVLYGTTFKITTFLFHLWPIEALIVELAIPALILLIAVIRKKVGRPRPT